MPLVLFIEALSLIFPLSLYNSHIRNILFINGPRWYPIIYILYLPIPGGYMEKYPCVKCICLVGIMLLTYKIFYGGYGLILYSFTLWLVLGLVLAFKTPCPYLAMPNIFKTLKSCPRAFINHK